MAGRSFVSPSRQWVIEDKFPLGRPAWESVGAQMTNDVLPYELMKLRLLNAGHQAICYIGMLLGYRLVHKSMEDKEISGLFRRMMDEEVTSLLLPAPGVDLDAYKATLVERFSNSKIEDTLARLGTEGLSAYPEVCFAFYRGTDRTGRSTKDPQFYCCELVPLFGRN